MIKYFRVVKETPLWEIGAIISDELENEQYIGIEDIWNKTKNQTEYLSRSIIEENVPEFFQRVYKSNGEKLIFKTAEQMKKVYEGFVEDVKDKTKEIKKGRYGKS